MDTYNNFVNRALSEKLQEQNEESIKKNRNEAIAQAVGTLDEPLSLELIKHSLTSESAKNALKIAIKKLTGYDGEDLDKLISNVQENGLKGLQDSVTEFINNKAGNFIDSLRQGNIDINSLGSNLKDAITKVKQGGMDNLQKFKDTINNKLTEKYKSLKQEGQDKLNELKQQADELEGRINVEGIESGVKEDLQNQLNDIYNQASNIKESYKSQLEDLRGKGKQTLDSIQEEINNQSDNILNTEINDSNVNNIEDSLNVEPTPTHLTYDLNNSDVSQMAEEAQNKLSSLISSPDEALTEIQPTGVIDALRTQIGRFTGSDSTIARALQRGRDVQNKMSDIIKNKQTEIQELKPTQPEAEQTIIPETQLEAEGLEEKAAGQTAKSLLKQGAKEVGIDVGEEAGEEAGTVAAELGLGDIIPGLGLLAGLGTLIGQTIEQVKEAKRKAHINIVNPSTNFGT